MSKKSIRVIQSPPKGAKSKINPTAARRAAKVSRIIEESYQDLRDQYITDIINKEEFMRLLIDLGMLDYFTAQEERIEDTKDSFLEYKQRMMDLITVHEDYDR